MTLVSRANLLPQALSQLTKIRGCLVLIALFCLGADSSGLAQPSGPVDYIETKPENADAKNETSEKSSRKEKRSRDRSRIHSDNRDVFLMGTDLTQAPGESARNIVLIGGDLEMGGSVDYDVVVIGGDVRITGKVGHDVTVIGGSLTLEKDAIVEGDVVNIGGKFLSSSTSGIRKRFVFSAPPSLGWVEGYLREGPLLGRPLVLGQFKWIWSTAGVLFLFHALLLFLFAAPIRKSMTAVEAQPIASFFAGLGLLISIPAVILLLLISVLGILAIPIFFAALLGALILGKITVYAYLGSQLLRLVRGNATPPLLLALTLGTVAFYLLYAIPILGFMVWGTASVLALGAVFITIINSLRREAPPVPVAVGISSAGSVPGAPTTPDDWVVMVRAGFWRRFLATFLDSLIFIFLVSAIGPFALPFWVAYHVILWTWKGTTIGGIVMGIKVIRINGSELTLAVAVVRSLSSFFSALVLFLGFFWVAWDREKQSWHDKIAGTVIVKVPKTLSLV